MLHGSSLNPQIADNVFNKIMESGKGDILKSRLTMLNRLLHDLKLTSEEGRPITKAQNAIMNINTAHPIGLIPEPRGTARNGMHVAMTNPLLTMPAASAIFPNSGILRNALNMETNVLIHIKCQNATT
jgi:hypothetical protein